MAKSRGTGCIGKYSVINNRYVCYIETLQKEIDLISMAEAVNPEIESRSKIIKKKKHIGRCILGQLCPSNMKTREPWKRLQQIYHRRG